MSYKTIAAVLAALTGVVAFASATFDEATGVLTFDVASGQSETYASIGATVTKVVRRAADR